ncbi:hypothetical protein [Algoriphagus machipongonensis]|uniref:Replicative DNA helicase n=1 Tax=Algoriphagus machipongonensis TaxID=388413 RepID=A3I233_9BACT|nr:hypothetical protein [Algoriphagus machipongonensis]EAZ79437.1 putative replicative DNA helicase [Algoriphagus machipongonensis]
MEKFKELKNIELIEIGGGQDDYFFTDKIFDHWAYDILNAMNNIADSISGFGDGFVNGFKDTNQKW